MRRIFLPLILIMMLLPAAGIHAQSRGVEVTCPDGNVITNAVEFIVNMRPGFTYTATALGINGFDPVMAVADRGVVRACADDSEGAADYSANLPTTGQISASELNAQLPFSHRANDFVDISIIVGGFGGAAGEFLLILEGMAVTELDGEGDPFSIHITENITESIDAAAYMLATNGQLDPLMRIVDTNGEVIMECDDAGKEDLCEEGTFSLANASVSRTQGRTTPNSEFNAMLMLPTTQLDDLDFSKGYYFNFLMTSYEYTTTGNYVVAFHVGIGETGSSKPDSQTVTPTDVPPTGAGVSGGSIDIICPDGTEHTNMAEVVVNMRSGFQYTATAIGVDNFDPVMAVGDRTGVVACADDSAEAASYSADLPTTGHVATSNLNAQMLFSHNYEGFEDVSIFVGGFGGAAGEMVLILEGMAVTPLDGEGDPFSVRITPNIVNANSDMTAYMFSLESQLDPLMRMVDSDREVIFECDDAGDDTLCSPGSSDLSNSYVSRTLDRRTPSASTNAMLVIPTRDLTDLDFTEPLYLSFLMTSYGETQGEYVVAFHIAIAEPRIQADL